MTLTSCPACDTPLGLFTPREGLAHVNACLDAQDAPSPSAACPTCAVCHRDLTALTPTARLEHANRCADSTLPLGAPPRRTARRPRSGATARPRPAAAAPAEKGDARVRRLLELLGLARYAGRFAEEEIDLVALRLLEDADFAQLRIPDAARRRIAEAMHSVPILAQIQKGVRESRGEERSADGQQEQEEDIVATQQFPESRLAQTMRRQDPLLNDGVSDGDLYTLTPESCSRDGKGERVATVSPIGRQQAEDPHAGEEDLISAGRSPQRKAHQARDGLQLPAPGPFCPQKPSSKASEGSASEEDGARKEGICSSAQVMSSRQESAQDENPKHVGMFSASEHDSDSSDVSSLGNFDDEVESTTQYSLGMKLEKWRRKQLRKEEQKHRTEVEREQKRHRTEIFQIHARYQEMQRRFAASRGVLKQSQCHQEPAMASAVEEPRKNYIDLTQCVSSDEGKIEKVTAPRNHTLDAQGSHENSRSFIKLNAPAPCERSTPSWFSDHSPVAAQSPNRSAFGVLAENEESKGGIFSSSDEEVMDHPPAATQSLNRAASHVLAENGKSNGGMFSSSDEEIIDHPPVATQSLNRSASDVLAENEKSRGGMFSSSDEEVMDLTCAKDSTLFLLQDEDTRQSHGGNTLENTASRIAGSQTTLGRDKSCDGEDAPTQSRLKKPKKVTRADILAAIRRDVALYDDILYMRTVEFERIFDSLKSSELNVPKQRLTSFLRKEGVAFKCERLADRSRGVAKKYFRRQATAGLSD